ncbi:MAG: hypothetical protein INR67_19245, partial [Jatrophihabitans endophyticus]
GRMPIAGDVVEAEVGPEGDRRVRLTVVRTEGRRVARVRLTPPPDDSDGEGDGDGDAKPVDDTVEQSKDHGAVI